MLNDLRVAAKTEQANIVALGPAGDVLPDGLQHLPPQHRGLGRHRGHHGANSVGAENFVFLVGGFADPVGVHDHGISRFQWHVHRRVGPLIVEAQGRPRFDLPNMADLSRGGTA